MTVTTLNVLGGVDDLVALLGIPLSGEQLAAVTAPLEPGVIVAGAGSGKTTAMAARVVWLVGTGQVLPDQVLGLTFTTRAAGELGTGVRGSLARLAVRAGTGVPHGQAGDTGEPTVATYHAYAASLLAEHGLRLGHETDLRVVADAGRYQLAARAVTSFDGAREHLSVALPVLIGQVVQLDNELSDHLVEIGDVRRFDRDLRRELAEQKQIREVADCVAATHTRDELLDLVAAYREAKADAGVTEFADQMARAARLAETCPEVGALERDRYRVVLLDEYQDTSVSQRRMLQGLFAATSTPAGVGHPVTAVGDPCQAIYGWRGASVDNIDEFPRHFPRADGTESARYTLSVNRRCARRVLDVANDLAAPLHAVHGGAAALVPRAEARSGQLRAALHETVVDEVSAVVDDVERIGQWYARRGDGGSWSDIAVLVRDGSERAALATGLRRRGIPVEVVGLTGLLSQPEVADVLATLRCVSSLTANAALLRLLAGPRWRIGPRDLALLGARGRQLARVDRPATPGLRTRLDAAVAGADATEVVSLSDALDDPGPGGYSPQARARFAALAGELTALRQLAGEPLVDLVRRVVEVLAIDIELATAPRPEADLARDNLALFLDAVGCFAGTDPSAGLFGLLAFLDAELERGGGMSVADPGLSDSVKLLTVHAAKGLEWRAVVLPFLAQGVFPSATPRSCWERTAAVVPAPLRGDAAALPRQRSWDKTDRDAYVAAQRAHQLLEERRLAYVAVTRAKEVVVASGHWWGRSQKRPRGPSDHLDTLRAHADSGPWCWAPAPAQGAANPCLANRPALAFPGRLDEARLHRRRQVADDVRRALVASAAEAAPRDLDLPGVDLPDLDLPGVDLPDLDLPDLDLPDLDLCGLDAEIDALLAEACAASAAGTVVDLPSSVSATIAARAHTEPQRLARELARPMPRRPSVAARFGTRFHAYLESRFGQQQLIDPDELPGRADSGIDDDADLAAVIAAFESGPFAERRPDVVEAPFQVVLAGRVVRGRIDAVYRSAGGGYDVVDWKTGHREDADETQLAIYRVACAELYGVPLDRVRARFCFVRTGMVLEPDRLPDRAALETRLFGAAS